MPYDPTTWVEGVTKLSPANLNNIETGLDSVVTALDAVIAASGVYQNYTPVLTGGSPTLGTGSTARGQWCRIGNQIHVMGRIIFGTGLSPGSGPWSISLPVEAEMVDANDYRQVGTAEVWSVSDYLVGTCWSSGATPSVFGIVYASVIAGGGSANSVGSASPWAWAAGDEIDWNLTYEAAH